MIGPLALIGLIATTQAVVPGPPIDTIRPAAMELVGASSDCMVATSGRLSPELEGMVREANRTIQRRAPSVVTAAFGKAKRGTRIFRLQAKEGDVWQVYRPAEHRCGVVALAGSRLELSSTFSRIMIGDGSSWKLMSGSPDEAAVYEWDIPGSAVGPAVLLRMTASFGHHDRPATIVISRVR